MNDAQAKQEAIDQLKAEYQSRLEQLQDECDKETIEFEKCMFRADFEFRHRDIGSDVQSKMREEAEVHSKKADELNSEIGKFEYLLSSLDRECYSDKTQEMDQFNSNE